MNLSNQRDNINPSPKFQIQKQTSSDILNNVTISLNPQSSCIQNINDSETKCQTDASISSFISPYIPLLYLEDFVSQSSISEYICHLCFGILWDPILDTCNHCFCKYCFDLYLSLHPNHVSPLLCPITQHPISIQTENNFIKAIIEKHIVFCHFRQEHCLWKGTVKEYLIHLEIECPRQRIQCPFQGCNQLLPREQMEEHIISCEYRIVKCAYCNHDTSYIELNTHYTICPKYIVECYQQCGIKVKREDINNHIQNECFNTKVKCPYYEIGCTSIYMKRDAELHSNEMYTIHLLLMYIHLLNRNTELENKVKELNTNVMIIQETNKLLNNKPNRIFNEEDDINMIINNINGIKYHNNRTLNSINKILLDNNIFSLFDMERIPHGVLINKKRICNVLSHKLEHKFVFVKYALNNNDNNIWKICFLKQPQWVFVGVCDKEKVIENNMKFFSLSEKFNHGCFGFSTNNLIWNANLQEQNNFCFEFPKIKQNDEVYFKYIPSKKELEFSFSNIKYTLLMVKTIISIKLTICVVFVNQGDEIEITLL